MNVRFAWIILVPCLVAADAAQEEAAKKDLQAMQGPWTLVSYIVNGKPTPSAEMAKIQLTVHGKVSTFVNDKKALHGAYTLDATKKPKTLDIDLTDGPDKGKKKLAIYALEKDQLKICVGAIGVTRPTELKAARSEPGNLATDQASNRQEGDGRQESDGCGQADASARSRALALHGQEPRSGRSRALHQPTGDLTESNLLNVYILEAIDKKIASLKGLEQCKNLASLKLTKNQVADLKPLRELTNLQSLDLADNKISDISPLAGLTKLQYLELENNRVAKIDAIAAMAALNSLYLGGNQIVDLTPVAKLSKLWTLSAPRNRIKDIGPIASLTRFSTLDLSDNQIADLAAFAKFKEINMLIIRHNKITDLTPLINLLKVDAQGEKRIGPFLQLYLEGNPLSDTAKGSQLQALKSFGARINS